ncbi:Aldo/keto reductase [Gautieria morchelliformis]|nr:Aldo/keto reductase [Gautieria morchelliformis]
MPYSTRKIGNTHVPAIGWGAMGISAFYGSIQQTEEERLKVLDRAFELGITHWDSADVYADSEELIGKWFAKTGKRDSVFLATKFGFQNPNVVTSDTTFTAEPTYIRQAVESSLRRLGIDCIDLYYSHRVDPKVPIEDTVGAMAELVKEGKVKYIGLSEPSPTALRRAHAVHPISAVQVEYSPFTLDIENPNVGLLATARELGITVVAYSPLGRGLLAGKFNSADDIAQDDMRRFYPRFSKESFPKILALLDSLKKISEKHNATTGQICLAWLLGQGEDIIPIPGTRTIKYIEQNAGAVNIELTPEESDTIRRAAIASGATDIPRYTESSMKWSGVDSPMPQERRE